MNIEEIKMDHFENFEELIKTCKLWIEIDDIDAYYRFFEFNCMKAFVTAYEKEKEKNSKIDEFCRKELAFKRRLQRENRQPDEFNQGRFYVSENIRKIIEEE